MVYKIEKPKFDAFRPLVLGIALTFGRIMTDKRAQVLEPDGRAAQGLTRAAKVPVTPSLIAISAAARSRIASL